MRQIAIALAALMLGFAGIHEGLTQTRELGSSGELLDGIAALVDEGVVLKSELRERTQLVAQNFIEQQMQLPPEQRSQLPSAAELEQQVLERLILEEIQAQRASNIGIEIGDDEVNQDLSRFAASQNVTLSELPALIEASGQSYQDFREEWRREVTIQILERVEVVNQISINPREFEQCVERAEGSQTDQFEYNVSHILIGFSADATSDEIAEAEEEARDLVRRLDNGEDFAQLAVAHSDSQSAFQGGALGWITGAALPSPIAADVLTMQVGEHSTPIRRPGGFHIARLNDLRGNEPQLVDQIRVRHILLSPTAVLDDEATRQKLIEIRNQIVGGEDFGAVASAVSEDSLSAVDGGDLGWREPGAYWPEFVEGVTSVDVGEISEPFQTPDGWHIAEVIGERSYDMTDDLREQQCQGQLIERKAGEELEIWRRQIRDQAYVVKRI